MVGIRLKHVERHKGGRDKETRYYYRVGKGKRIALEGMPGTVEFRKSYEEASSDYSKKQVSDNGTFNALAELYRQSAKYKKLKRSTQRNTDGVLNAFIAKHGHRRVSDFSTQAADKLFAEKSATPGAANSFLQRLKSLIALAIRYDWITKDPTINIEPFALGTHHTWTEKELEQFQNCYPVGTVQRTIFDLLLYTGQRVGDVCKMRWDDILEGNKITVKQEKTGKVLIIPIHSELLKSMENLPRLCDNIVANKLGKPYVTMSMSNLMAKAIEKAGLPKRCVAHGLRKANARRLAEAGSSVHQIQAVSGHVSLREVERYTRAVNQERLAGDAIAGLGKFKISKAKQGSKKPKLSVKPLNVL